MIAGRPLRSGLVAAIVVGGLSAGSAYLAHRPAPPAAIAYADAPLSTVLADLGRTTGFEVVVFPDVGRRRVSGVLDTRRGGLHAAQRIASSLGLTLRHAGPHWALIRDRGTLWPTLLPDRDDRPGIDDPGRAAKPRR